MYRSGVVQCLCVVQATNAFHRFRAWRIFSRVMQASWTVQKWKSGHFYRFHLGIKCNQVLQFERVLTSKSDQSNLHAAEASGLLSAGGTSSISWNLYAPRTHTNCSATLGKDSWTEPLSRVSSFLCRLFRVGNLTVLRQSQTYSESLWWKSRLWDLRPGDRSGVQLVLMISVAFWSTFVSNVDVCLKCNAM